MWVLRMDRSSDQGFLPCSLLHRILWSLTSKENLPTCCLISCEAKGVVYYQALALLLWVPRMDESSGQRLLPCSLLHRIIWSLTSKENPPTCCLISCEAKGIVYHQAPLLLWVPRMDGFLGQEFLPCSLLHCILWIPTSKDAV